MSDRSGIEWTDATWNPVTGCTKVSPGCDHCYAETMHERFNGKGSFATVTLAPQRMDVPLRWRKPRRVFVNSMSDLFHDDVPDKYIAKVFHTMATSQRHTYQVLTKRHGRMRSLLNSVDFVRLMLDVDRKTGFGSTRESEDENARRFITSPRWPLPNVWLGVSAEDQKWADIRIPALLDTPAAVRWISAEPLLGRIDLGIADIHAGHESDDVNGAPHPLTCLTCSAEEDDDVDYVRRDMSEPGHPKLGWVVVGGESGPGARPMNPEWARSLRNQCVAAEVPFLFKQWGAHDVDGRRVGKGRAGRVLDGRTWDGYPAVTS